MRRMTTAPKLPGLSIVLPCHDEGANIGRAIAEATRAAERVAEAHELLVVDDGSRDGTRGVAELASTEDARVRVLVHQRNAGYGAALSTGFMAARLAWVFLTDADLQFDLMELERFLPLAPDHDLICGYRIARADPLYRRANGAAWNALVRSLFDLPVRDVDCAFKLMRRELVQRLDLVSDGAMVSTELLARAQRAGARIAEVGVTHRPRVAGRASGANPHVVLGAFGQLRIVRRELRTDPGGVTPAPRPRPA
jgi:glycosyltransferase involved in cell wall biosynthesis